MTTYWTGANFERIAGVVQMWAIPLRTVRGSLPEYE